MSDLRILGILLQNSEGEISFVEVKDYIKPSPNAGRIEPGKISRSPTPEEVKISKEKAVDHTLNGVLNKHEVSTPALPQSSSK